MPRARSRSTAAPTKCPAGSPGPRGYEVVRTATRMERNESSPADTIVARMAAAPQTLRPDADAVDYTSLAAFFDDFAADEPRWRRRNRTYHRLLEQIYRFQIPEAARVLEIGSGSGDLLAALKPSVGVGVDVSGGMVELARAHHPELRFEVAAGETLDLGETFDYVVLSDLMPFVYDLLALFERVAAHSHPHTRIIVNSYSRVWRPIIRLAELLRLKPAKPIRNWVSPQDVRNLLELSGFDVVTSANRILLPKRIPLLTTFLNGVVANVWPFVHFTLTYWIVARPDPVGDGEETVSVVCPCRNESGHVPELVRRHAGRDQASNRRAPGTRHLARRPARARQGRRRAHGPRGCEERRADDPRRRPQRPTRGLAEVLPSARRGPRRVDQRLAPRLRRGAGRDALPEHARQPRLLAALQDRHRAAREGHALRHEGRAPARLRADRRRTLVLRRLRPVRRLRPALRCLAVRVECRRPP